MNHVIALRKMEHSPVPGVRAKVIGVIEQRHLKYIENDPLTLKKYILQNYWVERGSVSFLQDLFISTIINSSSSSSSTTDNNNCVGGFNLIDEIKNQKLIDIAKK
jgi:hypothetical protein